MVWRLSSIPNWANPCSCVLQAEAAGTVPIQDFDFIALAVAEDKQRAAKGGERHVLLNQQSEAVDTFAKIDGLTVKINL